MNVVRKNYVRAWKVGVFLVFVLTAYGAGAAAYLSSGKITWEWRGGFAYIVSSTVTAINRPDSPGTRACPGGCKVWVSTTGWDTTPKELPATATIQQVNDALRGLVGPTEIAMAPFVKGLCITLWRPPPATYPYVQDVPRGCNDNPDLGEPPISPPDPPLSCSLRDANIDHGAIDGTVADGHSSRTNVSVSCNGRTTVSVVSNSYDPSRGVTLNGPGGLKSFVTLDGKPADQGVRVDVNNSASISVVSTLQGNGEIAAGQYYGTVVLVATIV